MGNTTWNGIDSNAYEDVANWSRGVPTADDTAFFGNSNNLLIVISNGADVGQWIFNPWAPHYSFIVASPKILRFTGLGIVVNGGGVDITVHGSLTFQNNSSAGPAAIDGSGFVTFSDGSNAGSASIVLHPGGTLIFSNDSSAAGATIMNSGETDFGSRSTAGQATITTANGGQTIFASFADGGAAHFNTDAGSQVDFSFTTGHDDDGNVNAGSIAGAGLYKLGSNRLTVGGDNLSTSVSGDITGGFLVKVGRGTLSLSGHNTFAALTLAGGTVDLDSLTGGGSGSAIFTTGAQALRIESGALDHGEFSQGIQAFGRGDVIDLADLPFRLEATATFDASVERLVVTSGPVAVTLGLVHAPASTRFAALSDHTGGTEVRLATSGTATADTIDATHHPAGQLAPGGGPDVIIGLAGNDTLRGVGGDDILVGGLGKDELRGGPGADRFVFERPIESTLATFDTIADFRRAQHDIIDLYAMDADQTRTGNQAFLFIGADSFAHYHATHPGVIGMIRFAGGTVQGNVNAALGADFAVAVHGAAVLHAADFIL